LPQRNLPSKDCAWLALEDFMPSGAELEVPRRTIARLWLHRGGMSPDMSNAGVRDQDELRRHAAFEVHTVGFQEFTPSPTYVGEVRNFVKHTLEKADIEKEAVFECQLVADELAANAVRHGRSIFSVGIELTDEMVRIAVRDDSNALPVQRTSPPDAPNGRGLVIVSGAAEGWGSVPLGRGKEIWADVARPPD
jgi:anti-sigma regulatory factor (Ser/Thr protein kinase)